MSGEDRFPEIKALGYWAPTVRWKPRSKTMSGEMYNGRYWLSGEREFEQQSMEATLGMDRERMAMEMGLDIQRYEFDNPTYYDAPLADQKLTAAMLLEAWEAINAPVVPFDIPPQILLPPLCRPLTVDWSKTQWNV